MNNLIAYIQKKKFVIYYDEIINGYYIYIYDRESNKCVADYLQDTLDIAKSFVEEKYGVGINEWKEIKGDS